MMIRPGTANGKVNISGSENGMKNTRNVARFGNGSHPADIRGSSCSVSRSELNVSPG